jgi:hypothetical protein
MKQPYAFDQVTLGDPHSHAEVTVMGAFAEMESMFASARKQLDFEVESKYSTEIDKILEPTRLWGRFIPGNENYIQPYHHLEYPGGILKGNTSESKFKNPQTASGTLGRLCKIDLYVYPEYYDTKEVAGLLFVFENTELMLGSRRGGYVCNIELGKEAVIIGVTTKVSTDYRDRDRIEYIGLTSALATIDGQGCLRYDQSGTLGNEFQARDGVEYKEFTYTSEDGKSPPTCMLCAVGWSYEHTSDGCFGMFQPVLGSLEKIEKDGMSAWSFEN